MDWLDKLQSSLVVVFLPVLVIIIISRSLGIDAGSLPIQIGIICQIIGFVMILCSVWRPYTVSTDEGSKIVIHPITHRNMHAWGIAIIISGLAIQLSYV